MKLYFEAERFLNEGQRNGSKGVQNSIFKQTNLVNSPKHICALVFSTLKYREYIEAIIKKSKLRESMNKKVSDGLLMLLIHDLLFSSKGRIQLKKHPIKDAILKHKTRLSAELTKLKVKFGVKSAADLPNLIEDVAPVKWFRINLLKTSRKDFFEKHSFFAELTEVETWKLENTGYIYCDHFIPNLYAVHPRESLTSTKAYTEGDIIIQDRASCFPAHILNGNAADLHCRVIDSCAAPGNKTTQLASYLSSRKDAVIHAFEKDAVRVKTLRTMCEKAIGDEKNLIQIIQADFTNSDPHNFSDVTGIVVDPSCSGSGIFGREADGNKEEINGDVDSERLAKLSWFQFKIVCHALRFPNVRKVVYSTCSIHAQENEQVLSKVLQDPAVAGLGWKLASRDLVVPEWPRRGVSLHFSDEFTKEERGNMAASCIRAVPKEDGGIGFFAACFIRELAENSLESPSTEHEDEWTGFD